MENDSIVTNRQKKTKKNNQNIVFSFLCKQELTLNLYLIFIAYICVIKYVNALLSSDVPIPEFFPIPRSIPIKLPIPDSFS